jgi:hypothetical protein
VWTSKHYWEVAVYWPGDGYGGGTICHSAAEAEAERQRTLAQGYKNVHVREVTITVDAATATVIPGTPSIRERRMMH